LLIWGNFWWGAANIEETTEVMLVLFKFWLMAERSRSRKYRHKYYFVLVLTDWVSVTQDRGQGGGGDSCEHGNDPSVCINDGKFLDQVSDFQLLKRDSAAWSLNESDEFFL
jgi:hypothetical protein